MFAPMVSFISLLFISLITFFCSLVTFWHQTAIIIEWEMCHFSSALLMVPLFLESENLLLSSVIVFISANVMGFACTYMKEDPYTTRFSLLVLLFVLSMNMLIFTPNLLVMLLGWDGLGIISFLLVIYYSSPTSLSAGMITALTNRLGDALLLLSIAWLMSNNNWAMMSLWSSDFMPLITLSLTLAACTKSAQVPFSSWLPAAMAAPTPVSALVHSSTLVTAGVFILVRLYPFLVQTTWFSLLITSMSCMTMLMAGVSATVEPDLKKIIALSTLSQLGVMMASIGIGLPKVALFHLMTHALFKALLFMCAGNIIYFNLHNQDIRTTGNLLMVPLTSSSCLIANLALCGSPFLAAFYSKDIILETTLHFPMGVACVLFLFIATSFTAVYTTRFMLNLVWAPINLPPLNSMNESKMEVSAPLVFLTFGAICGGAVINWMLMPAFGHSSLPLSLKLLTIMITLFGLSCAASVCTSNMCPTLISRKALWVNTQMWVLSPLSKQMGLSPLLSMSFYLTHMVDQGWQEALSANGAMLFSDISSKYISPLQNNIISTQLLLGLISAVLLFNLV